MHPGTHVNPLYPADKPGETAALSEPWRQLWACKAHHLELVSTTMGLNANVSISTVSVLIHNCIFFFNPNNLCNVKYHPKKYLPTQLYLNTK